MKEKLPTRYLNARFICNTKIPKQKLTLVYLKSAFAYFNVIKILIQSFVQDYQLSGTRELTLTF